jgi:hypothetical protein
MRSSVVLVLSLLVFGTVLRSDAPGREAASGMAAAARAFLGALTADERRRAQLAFDVDERSDWTYVPRPRKGIALGELDAAQLGRAMELLRAGFSQKGFDKAETIRALEDVLVELGESPRVRDKALYYLTVFGEPSDTGTWGLRYEGHHLSQSWTIVAGTAIATTPQFLGANPATVAGGPMKGTRVLAAEEDLARGLVFMLSDVQLVEALIGTTAPPEILSGTTARAAMLEDRGVAYGSLAPEQQRRLWALLEEHAAAQRPELAAERLARVKKAGVDRIKFAWMGGLARGEGHYYRIQGPTFLVEYDNTQDGANHVHTVWRDFDGDFGRDLLAEHHATEH